MFEAGMGTHAPRTGLRFARSEMQAVNSLSIRSMACTCRIGTRQDGFHLIHCDLLEIFRMNHVRRCYHPVVRDTFDMDRPRHTSPER